MNVFSILLAAFAIVAAPAAALTERQYQQEFTNFVQTYNKSYSHEDFFKRYTVFKSNLDAIQQHNAKSDASYFLKINEFADLELEEFHAKMTGYTHREQAFARSKNVESFPAGLQYPTSLDWVSKGAVTAVKNQGSCGSCWSFSTTGSTEGAHAILTGNLVSLSEQQLIDCSTSYGNQGCNGGIMQDAFEYIIANGITSEAAYPYQAASTTCKSGLTVEAKLSAYSNVASGDESALIAAVNHGPVSVAIEADTMAFQFYGGGVFDNSACGTSLDHGVLIAGYGTESGKDYWLVKNSWGASWGESGYIKIVRNKNMCGIALDASYPIAKK